MHNDRVLSDCIYVGCAKKFKMKLKITNFFLRCDLFVQKIMLVLQIKFSVAAVRNVRGLPFIEDLKRRVAHIDLFDWLQFCFGFQVKLN